MTNHKIIQTINEGEFAFRAGVQMEENPNESASSLAIWWLFGWTHAYMHWVETQLKANNLTRGAEIAILNVGVSNEIKTSENT